ncbi:MAG: hydrogenase maturation nickel metallochaperone HypA/HybF [Planctomycetota bacterium]
MHETMVAHSLLDAISEEASKLNARPISARISCGKLSGVNDEILRFAFEAIAEETPCKGMKLQIEHKPLLAKCKNCSSEFEVDLSEPICSDCESADFELLGDAPLLLEEIEFETD